jgi:hypothetical protein
VDAERYGLGNSLDLESIQGDVLTAFTDNIHWFARHAAFQRSLFILLGLLSIVCQVGTLSSFGLKNPQLEATVSPILAGAASLLLAILAFLSPGAKWKECRSAEHQLRAQHFMLRIELNGAADSEAKRKVLEKFITLGSSTLRTAAAAQWRLLAEAVSKVNASQKESHSGNG